MPADRPTAHRPRVEIDAFESKMDLLSRSWAQTKSKPVTDSALEGSWLSTSQKEARSVHGLSSGQRCCNSIRGRKFALVANRPWMKSTQLNVRWARTFDHRLKLNQSRTQRAHWLSPESSPDSVGLDCRSGAGAPRRWRFASPAGTCGRVCGATVARFPNRRGPCPRPATCASFR